MAPSVTDSDGPIKSYDDSNIKNFHISAKPQRSKKVLSSGPQNWEAMGPKFFIGLLTYNV